MEKKKKTMTKADRRSIGRALKKDGQQQHDLEKILLKFARKISRAVMKAVLVDQKLSPQVKKNENLDDDLARARFEITMLIKHDWTLKDLAEQERKSARIARRIK